MIRKTPRRSACGGENLILGLCEQIKLNMIKRMMASRANPQYTSRTCPRTRPPARSPLISVSTHFVSTSSESSLLRISKSTSYICKQVRVNYREKTSRKEGFYRSGERGIRTPVTQRVNRISSAAHSTGLCHLSKYWLPAKNLGFSPGIEKGG